MPEVELAKIQWKAPLDDWSPLCDNRLELDRSTNLADAPHKMNQIGVGIGAAKCEQCITSQLKSLCSEIFFPKWKKLPIVRVTYNGAFSPVLTGDAYQDNAIVNAYPYFVSPIQVPPVQSSFSGRMRPLANDPNCSRGQLFVGESVSVIHIDPSNLTYRIVNAQTLFSSDLYTLMNNRTFSASVSALVSFSEPKPIGTLDLGQVLANDPSSRSVQAFSYAQFSCAFSSPELNVPNFAEPEIGQVFQMPLLPAQVLRRRTKWTFLLTGDISTQIDLGPEYLTVPDSVTIQILGY